MASQVSLFKIVTAANLTQPIADLATKYAAVSATHEMVGPAKFRMIAGLSGEINWYIEVQWADLNGLNRTGVPNMELVAIPADPDSLEADLNTAINTSENLGATVRKVYLGMDVAAVSAGGAVANMCVISFGLQNAVEQV